MVDKDRRVLGRNASARGRGKAVVFAAIAVSIAFAVLVFDPQAVFDDPAFISSARSLVQDNLAVAAIAFIASMVVAGVVFALPGVMFALIAGPLFGPMLGCVLCSIGATLGAMVSFLVGRYFLRDSFRPAIEKNALLRRWLFDETNVNQVILLMITRLVPIFPYNLQNYAYGLTSMSFGVYSLFSFLFMLPGIALYTVAAAGIFDASERTAYLGFSAVLAVLIALAAIFIRKRYLKEDGSHE